MRFSAHSIDDIAHINLGFYSMVNGFLALTMLSPHSANSVTFQGNGTPALSITHASLDMLADSHTPFAPVSAWVSEPFTPKALCV